MFTCDVCGKLLKSKQNLKYHVKTHTDGMRIDRPPKEESLGTVPGAAAILGCPVGILGWWIALVGLHSEAGSKRRQTGNNRVNILISITISD